MQYGYKKYADFESVEQVAKKLMRKSERKMEFLTFITGCKSFWPITSLGEFFAFFQRIRLGIEFCV
jgi:hypothetical protein